MAVDEENMVALFILVVVIVIVFLWFSSQGMCMIRSTFVSSDSSSSNLPIGARMTNYITTLRSATSRDVQLQQKLVNTQREVVQLTNQVKQLEQNLAGCASSDRAAFEQSLLKVRESQRAAETEARQIRLQTERERADMDNKLREKQNELDRAVEELKTAQENARTNQEKMLEQIRKLQSGTGVDSAAQFKQINDLQTQLNQSQSAASKLTSEIDNATKRFQAERDNLSANYNSQIQALQKEQNDLNAQLASTSSQLRTTSTDLATCRTNFTKLSSDFSALNDQQTTVLTNVTTGFAMFDSKIQSLTSRLTQQFNVLQETFGKQITSERMKTDTQVNSLESKFGDMFGSLDSSIQSVQNVAKSQIVSATKDLRELFDKQLASERVETDSKLDAHSLNITDSFKNSFNSMQDVYDKKIASSVSVMHNLVKGDIQNVAITAMSNIDSRIGETQASFLSSFGDVANRLGTVIENQLTISGRLENTTQTLFNTSSKLYSAFSDGVGKVTDRIDSIENGVTSQFTALESKFNNKIGSATQVFGLSLDLLSTAVNTHVESLNRKLQETVESTTSTLTDKFNLSLDVLSTIVDVNTKTITGITNQFETRIQGVGADVGSLRTQFGNIQTNVTNTINDVGALTKSFDSIQTDVRTFAGKFDDVTSALSRSASKFQDKFGSVDKVIDSLDKTVATRINGVTDTVLSVNDAIMSLNKAFDNRVQTFEGQFTTITSSFGSKFETTLNTATGFAKDYTDKAVTTTAQDLLSKTIEAKTFAKEYADQKATIAMSLAMNNVMSFTAQTNALATKFDQATISLQTYTDKKTTEVFDRAIASVKLFAIQAADMNIVANNTLLSAQSFASAQANAAYIRALSNVSSLYVQTPTMKTNIDTAVLSTQNHVMNQLSNYATTNYVNGQLASFVNNTNFTTVSTLLGTTVANVNTVSALLGTTVANVNTVSALLGTTVASTNQAVTSIVELSTRLSNVLGAPLIAAVKANPYDLMNALIPPGTMWPYAGKTLTNMKGWLFCDGAEYKQTDYPLLFAAIGTTYTLSAIAALGRFNVPDMQNQFMRGSKRLPDGTYTTGISGGSNNVRSYTLTGQNMPSHGHGVRVGNSSKTVGDPEKPNGNANPSFATLNLKASEATEKSGTSNSTFNEPSTTPVNLDFGYRLSTIAASITNDILFNQGGIVPSGRENPVPVQMDVIPAFVPMAMIIKADR